MIIKKICSSKTYKVYTVTEIKAQVKNLNAVIKIKMHQPGIEPGPVSSYH